MHVAVIMYVFSKQLGGRSSVEQRELYRSQSSIFSWHQLFFCCGSCQKQKVYIPSLQQGSKTPGLFGMTNFDLASKNQQA